MCDLSAYPANPGKELTIEVEGFGRYARYPVKTHVVDVGEDLQGVLERYVVGKLRDGDCLFLSEKLVAICQGRAFDIDDISPRPLARLLCRFVYHSPYGIGLGSPWTMELALRDAGIPRILLAALCSALTKPFGIRGVFYRVAGIKARAIDGPCDCTIPPYNHYAKMAPAAPDQVARTLSDRLGCPVVIIDANDLSVEVLGRSSRRIDPGFCRQVFRDNPLGQSAQSTPIAIVRKLPAPKWSETIGTSFHASSRTIAP
ncbi:MAG: coenzyme F420-0:L-glutamate ligase [Roseburia sp.]|nr:coenzyme F420-0:L-glutamate ligase [Roseburia sp.]MCM1098804.1 coenzyme F420-0:L-glutamate ligase [Ruminococcus flavefaciens]